MQAKYPEQAVALLITYNTVILNKLSELESSLRRDKRNDTGLCEVSQDLCSELKNGCNTILQELSQEEKIEFILRQLDKQIAGTLKLDIERLGRIIDNIKEFCLELEKTGTLSNASFERINSFLSESQHILQKDIYIEMRIKQILTFAKQQWKANIQDKTVWLYHGTSILFLPYVQKFGLDPSKLPSGIKRGIESLSQVFLKYGYAPGHGTTQDVTIKMQEKGISLSFWGDSIRTSASAIDLPAFMYELFNEEHIRKNPKIREIIGSLNTEELKLFNTIMRFGRVLRTKNKVILLHIKLDSAFLKYLEIPDFIADYDVFFSTYFLKRMPRGTMADMDNRVEKSVSYLCKNIAVPFLDLYREKTKCLTGEMEILMKKPIPPQFIYLEISSPEGYTLMNISAWNEKKNVRII